MDEKTKIVRDNQNLIYALASRFRGYPYKDDLYQAGMIGLLEAYKNFNPDLNVKFSTYAYNYILGEMQKLVREDKGIKISRQISSLNLKIEKVRGLLAQKLAREPSIDELASYLEIPSYYISEALKTNGIMQSLDEPFNLGGKDLSLLDIITNDKDIELLDLIALKEELERLSPFERELIQKRYLEDMTQVELSSLFKMSQVQVSRKEKKVLQKLYNHLS